jgi:hypothetical protein
MYENYVPWESGVPADLRTAVKALRESFDDAHFHFGSVTKNFCYALLHPDTVSQESVEYAETLVKLKERIGPAASQRFNETFALGTEPAVFKSLFDFYLEGLSTQVLLIFKALAKIGRVNESRLSAPHLEWAESQTKLLIGSNIHCIDIWVRAVCDTDRYDPAEDWEERISRTKWQAPRFLIMKPSRNEPYDAARAWERVDAETSMRWRKTFYEHYVRHLELKLRNLAGDAAVELAMQPKPAKESSQSNKVQDSPIRRHDTADSLSEPAEPNSESTIRVLRSKVKTNRNGTVRTDEAAKVLGVSSKTINRKVKSGLLTAGAKRGTITNASLIRRMPQSDISE